MAIVATDTVRNPIRRRLLVLIFALGLVLGGGTTYLVWQFSSSSRNPLGTLVAAPGAQVLASETGHGNEEVIVQRQSSLKFHRLGLDAICVGQNDRLVVQVYTPGLAKPLGFIPICSPSGGGMWEVALPQGTVGYPEKIVVRTSSSTRWRFMLVNSENSLGMVLVRSQSCVIP